MMLGNLAKADRMQFKKLSYFRLVFYKLYAGNPKRSNQKVENLVESVEFHRENRLERLSFELSPQSFQLVEKVIGPLRIVYHIFVENFFSSAKQRMLVQQQSEDAPVRQKHFCKKERGLPKRKMRQTVNRV